jgi:hypothetical protein
VWFKNLLKACDVDLTSGGSYQKIRNIQEQLSDYKIVYYGLKPDRVIFSRNFLSAKKLYLLHDRDFGHFNVITNLKVAMDKKYMCNRCDTLYDNKHECDEVVSCVLLHHPVLRIRPRIMVHATDWFSVMKFSESHNIQSERQAILSVETGMPKL